MTFAPSLVTPPSRVPESKRLYAESVHDPKLRAAGLSARGLYAMILAGADADGVFRDEGSQTAEAILAHAADVTDTEVAAALERLTREGLVTRSERGIALPRDTFARRQMAPASSPTPPAEHAARRATARRSPAHSPGSSPTAERRGGRPPRGRAAMSPAERKDRYHFARSERAFAKRPDGMSFEVWLSGTSEGASWLNHRRARDPNYAPFAERNARNETGNGPSETSFVPPAAPSRTIPLEDSGKERTIDAGAARNETSGTKPVPAPSGDSVPRAAEAADDAAPPPSRRALPSPEAMRAHRRSANHVARRFVDAVNAPGLAEGMPVAREVVMEFGRWTNIDRDFPLLGAALIDAGALPGSPLFVGLVDALRDRATFRTIYRDRTSCVAACRIEVHDLVRQDAFGLKQALNHVLATRGETLLLLPPRAAVFTPRRDDARRRQSGEVVVSMQNTDGPATVREITWE